MGKFNFPPNKELLKSVLEVSMSEVINVDFGFDDLIEDLVGKSDSVTYVCFVMDHSGSMRNNKKQSMSNFNEQLKVLKDKKDMQTLVTIVEFDNEVKVPVKNQLVEETSELDKYWTGGMTALYDGISYGIATVRSMMDKDPRDDKAALVLVQTDGGENASSDYQGEEGRKAINKLREELEDTGKWSFVFLAEGIDEKLAADLGVAAMSTMSYNKNDRGYQKAAWAATAGLDKYMMSRRVGETQTKAFFAADDKKEEEDEG